MPGMTFYEAALTILRSADRPLTTEEITKLALERKLVQTAGKTPKASMVAILYRRVGGGSGLFKIEAPGYGRAKRGSVK